VEYSAASHGSITLGERAFVPKKDETGRISEAVLNVRVIEKSHMHADNGTTIPRWSSR
jgi:hypothetical protein